MSPEIFAKPLSRITRWRWKKRWTGQRDGLILMYHRISNGGPDPWGLAVSPKNFGEQLQVLRRHFRPTRLRQLQSRTFRAHGPPSVTITFDDGYADNALSALPLIDAAGIPATVFVATSFIGSTGTWWDRLANLLLVAGRLPDVLRLRIRGRDVQFTLGAAANYSIAEYNKHRAWPAFVKPAPTQRQSIFLSLWESMLPLTEDERRDILDDIARWAGSSGPPTTATTSRMLSSRELLDLSRDGLIEVGAHTVSHCVLPDLPLETQETEVVTSKRVLEDVIGKPIESFSYPYGRSSAPTRLIVRDAGFKRACSTRPRRVNAAVNPFDLPRVSVPDCDGDQFERTLYGYFE